MFNRDETYSREQIHEALGGSVQSYLPYIGGRVVCACLRPDTNPDAPDIILAGTGEGIEGAAELLAEQGGSIPVFVKRGTKRWQYVGEFTMERFSRDPAEIEVQSRRSGRKDITTVIHMTEADQILSGPV